MFYFFIVLRIQTYTPNAGKTKWKSDKEWAVCDFIIRFLILLL